MKYNLEFQKRLGKNIGKPYNVFNTEKEMKGNLWDRWFNRPSVGYKGFSRAMKDYTNPKSEHYLDKEHLKYWAYLSNYNINGKKLEPTLDIERRRMEFVDQTLDTLTEMERDEAKITEQINNDIASKSVQDPASIKREAVFDNDKSLEDIFGKENLKEGIDLNKSFIVQKDEDDVSNDDQEMELE